VNDPDPQTPPVGEEIHLPGPSLLPLLSALAVTLIVVGTTIGWWLSIVGGILFVVTTVRWIRDTRRDVESLPDEHQ
jgi:Flp pilus assembly protein TadB